MNTSSWMVKALVGAAVAGGLVAGGSAALAKPDHVEKGQKVVSIDAEGETHIGGVVSGVSGSNISLVSWLGTWVIDASHAKMNFNSLADVKAGDKLAASGKLSASGLSLVANAIHDFSFEKMHDDGDDKKEEEHVKKRHIKGTIENFNQSKGIFTLDTKRMGEVEVKTSNDTKIFLPHHAMGALGNLTNGMKVLVSGVLDVGAKSMNVFHIQVK